MNKNELFDSFVDELINLIVATDDKDTCQRVLTSITSAPEADAIAQRLAAAKMLLGGKAYSEIVKETDISAYILANIHSMLCENDVKPEDLSSKSDAEYTSFAAVYDALTGDIEYEKRVKYIEKLFKKFGAAPQLVLDLGCGTGNITEIMAERGYNMIGVDSSVEMLDVAINKKKQTQHDILYLNQQMQNFELYGTVDAVLCLLDSLNYLTEPEDVLQTFKLVNNYLNPDGLFIFDVNTPYKLKNVLAGNTFCGEGEGVYYTWENVYDPDEKIAEFKLEFFVRENKTYSRKTELHYQRAYSDSEIKKMLKKAGLTLLASYSDLTLDAPQHGTQKVFYVAKKENLLK